MTATRKIKTWRNPYSKGSSLCTPREIEIHEGITVLVGCNGSGKTTLMRNIEDELRIAKVPTATYYNLTDGGSHAGEDFLAQNMISLMAAMWTHSEGECININLALMASKLNRFIEEGDYYKDEQNRRLARLLQSKEDIEKEKAQRKACKERWLLFDSVDSGMSIDNLVELKNFFNQILEISQRAGVTTYIVITANGYELVDDMDCMDVTTGKYIRFKDYADFRKFILKSKQKKLKRQEREEKTNQKNK